MALSQIHPLDSQIRPLDSQIRPLDSQIRPLDSQIPLFDDLRFLDSTAKFVHSTPSFLHSTLSHSFTPHLHSSTPHCHIPSLHDSNVSLYRRKSQLPSDGHSVRSTRIDISYIIAHPPAYMTGECTKTLQKVWLLKEKWIFSSMSMNGYNYRLYYSLLNL